MRRDPLVRHPIDRRKEGWFLLDQRFIARPNSALLLVAVGEIASRWGWEGHSRTGWCVWCEMELGAGQ